MSNDVVWRKEVPLGGLIVKKKNLGVHLPRKPQKSGRGQGFSSQTENFNNVKTVRFFKKVIDAYRKPGAKNRMPPF
jgi:hypothetical protein